MAVYQPIHLSTDTPPSQASQLPQGKAASRTGSAFDLAFDLDLRRPVKPRWPQAGIAQWAPRHGCRGSRDTAMDGRSRRAHGAMPDCGHAEPRRGTEWWGKSPFGYFWGSFPKVTRRKGGTLSGRNRSNGYAHTPNNPKRASRVDTHAAISADPSLIFSDKPLSQASPHHTSALHI